MFLRSTALAALLVLLICGAALGAPVTVQLRVEGATSTIFEGPVTTDGHEIDKGDGPHPCDGTNGGANPTPGPTMTSALDDASLTGAFSWGGTWFSFGDFGVDRIGPDANDVPGNHFWGYALDYASSQVGGCQQQVKQGQEVLFGFDYFSKSHLLKLDGPPRAAAGRAFDVTVTDGATGTPIPDASITGATGSATGPDGHATVSFDSPGLKQLKAERADSLRSNAVNVCISATGTGDCGVSPAQLGSTNRLSAVNDAHAPLARISGPRDGQRYTRGPRLLSGVASDDTGVTDVKLAFRRHLQGHCQWWSGRREKFAGSNCHKKFFFTIGHDASWSYLMPRALEPGRYVLDVKAFDRARNRDEKFVRGRNRVVFYVAAKPGHRGRTARAAPAVRVMLAGKSLRRAAVEHPDAQLVRVAGRSCTVGARTPLAALAALLRKTGVGYRLRDYGHCSRSSAKDAGQLFVSRIGGERNRGSDGWFYKVNDRAPEIGAGDTSGRRLRAGDRVLWFYCLFAEAEASCQRSLRALPDAGAAAGKPLRVRVRGFDNQGHSVAVPGATVTLGQASAMSGPDGVARVVPVPIGRADLAATKDGMVSSFPVPIDVK